MTRRAIALLVVAVVGLGEKVSLAQERDVLPEPVFDRIDYDEPTRYHTPASVSQLPVSGS